MGKKHTLLKELCPKHIRENSFEGGPGGGAGVLSYGTPWQTPAGGNITQNPDHFSNSGKSTNHMNNQSGSADAQFPERPDRQSSSGGVIHPGSMQDKSGYENSPPIGTNEKPHVLPDKEDDQNKPLDSLGEPSPEAEYDKEKSQTPLNPDHVYDKDVDQMFKKKETPSPDELMSALQYELGQMVKKDKAIAKKIVLQHLKENPHYYSELDMLNMDDKKMKVDESQISKTKAVLDEMIAAKQKRQMAPPPHLDEILKDMRYKRFANKQS